uniref:C-type lectin domain-containing protein n=1 Tax=Plectus sambesii TaxID=2011161 RepID=A0A914UMP0_9BILA
MRPVLSVLMVLASTLVFDITSASPCCTDGFSLYTEQSPKTKPMCYKAINDWKANFERSREGCKSIGGRLATIHSPIENQFVLDLAKNISSPDYVWIGLVKDEKTPVTPQDPTGNWVWAEDKAKPTYSNWLKGFPGNWEGQTCSIMYVNPGQFGSVGGEWRDAKCETLEAPYICEKDPCVCGKTCDNNQ